MGSIHIQMFPKAFAAGAPPQIPNSKGERFRPLQIWHAETELKIFFIYSLRTFASATHN